MFVLTKGEGVPVLLIHGVAGDHRIWYPFLRKPVPGFRFLAVDLPGHGRSGGKALGRVEDYAQAILEGIGDEIAGGMVMGFSMGGGVAVSLYALAPSLFKALILVSSAFRMPLISPTLDREGMCRRIYLSERLRRMCLRELRRVPEEVMRTDRRAAAYDLLGLAPSVDVPVLFVYGTLDTLLRREFVLESFRRVRKASLSFVPSSHMLPVEAPEALRRATLNFTLRL